MEEPQEPGETLHETNSHMRKPTWEQELLQDAERYVDLDGMHRLEKETQNIQLCGPSMHHHREITLQL